MKSRFLLSVFSVLFIIYQALGQEELSYQKAKFKQESHVDWLSKKTNYPIESLKKGEEGFVIISFRITSSGNISEIEPLEYPSPDLLKEAVYALNTTSGLWMPSIIDHIPKDYTYIIPFHFIALGGETPPDFLSRAIKLQKKGKYEKMLNICLSALKYNPYDFEFYKLKAEAKKALGNHSGADQEMELYHKMRPKLLETVSIIASAQIRVEEKRTTTVTRNN